MERKTRTSEPDSKAEEHTIQREKDARRPFAWLDDVDRWFEDFRKDFDSRFWTPWVVAPWERRKGTGLRQPLTDLVDDGREFVVKAELPGVTKDDLDISLTEDSIELRAEVHRDIEEKERDYYYRERVSNRYHRVLPFPEAVLPDQAEATLKDGVLEVRVPKKQPTSKREPVKVRVS